MKKAIILSGAYKNAGDFLIVDRCKKLFRKIYPQIILIELPRNIDLSEQLDEINTSDALVLAGGPLYFRDSYPRIIPLVDNLDQISTKIITVGCGISALDDSEDAIYEEFRFDAKMSKLLERIEKDQGYLSCRDFKTAEALKNQGFRKTLMTGCPAWYDLENIYKLGSKRYQLNSIENIYISDPAYEENLQIVIELINYLKKRFQTSKITLIFHRGGG